MIDRISIIYNTNGCKKIFLLLSHIQRFQLGICTSACIIYDTYGANIYNKICMAKFFYLNF